MDYKSTLNLPMTDFSMKATLAQREPGQIARWEKEKTYQRMIKQHQEMPLFVLHDGPPYANGDIHLGHALNKVLKDIVVKYKNMSGFHCEFIPGWDCHGLPIEMGVEKNLREAKIDKNSLSRVEVRNLCSDFADHWITTQREQFKRLLILADWERPYLTKSKEYVADILRELGNISAAGSLYKGVKPVYWSWAAGTALAEAEIEYHDHESPSIFVKFFFDKDSLEKNTALKKISGGKPVALVIWTTTPWTLPANLAISLHPDFEYVAIDVGSEVLVVAEGLREKFLTETGLTGSKVATIESRGLEKLNTDHPFIKRKSVVVLGEHVTLEAGTGAVHTAPGHGVDDYKIGQRYGLEVLCPVDGSGKFNDELAVELSECKGMQVFKANPLIVEKLKTSGHLIKASKIKHPYPHCWRTGTPIIFRATPQWFIGMEKTNLRRRAVEEIHKVQWIPSWGINRILGMVESRPDWCISRQRIWGVPITVFYDDEAGDCISSKESFDFIAALIEELGPNAWYELPIEKLLKPGMKCDSGKPSVASRLRKENDILDVWFDSGVSYAAVLLNRPADLYLEGSDQHRGWFQTSLLASVESHGHAPYKKVLTHGFVNDKDGKKMSKSKGNVTDPIDFASKFGSEILRLWVVVEDYRNDVNFSMETIERVSESYRKIRNTIRYILGNCHDYDKATMEPGEFCELDAWALEKTRTTLQKIKQAYEAYEFHTVYHLVINFCINDLSAVYFDILKDRLYTSAKNSKERRSSQAALVRIGEALALSLAPILSFTSEEVWAVLKKENSVFEAEFPTNDPFWNENQTQTKNFEKVAIALSLREPVNKALEEKRQAREIGHPLEAALDLTVTPDIFATLGTLKEDLARFFIVSTLNLKSGAAIEVKVSKAPGRKCARCWGYFKSVGLHEDHPELCDRCFDVVKGAAG